MKRGAFTYQLMDTQDAYLKFLSSSQRELTREQQIQIAGEVTRLEARIEHHKPKCMVDTLKLIQLIIPSNINDT